MADMRVDAFTLGIIFLRVLVSVNGKNVLVFIVSETLDNHQEKQAHFDDHWNMIYWQRMIY